MEEIQPILTELPKKNSNTLKILILVLITVSIGGILILFFLNIFLNNIENINESQSPILPSTSELKLVFPYVINKSIYLYEEGKDSLLVYSSEKENSICQQIQDEKISPNGKFLIFIENQVVYDVNDTRKLFGSCAKTLKLYIVGGEVTDLKYSNPTANWNKNNELEISSVNNDGSVKYSIYNPVSNTEKFSETASKKYSSENIFAEGENKFIRLKNDNFILVKNGSESLISEAMNKTLRGFSPNGRFAIFKTEKEVLLFDTENDNSISRFNLDVPFTNGTYPGLNFAWLFNNSFVQNCSNFLYNINNTNRQQLVSLAQSAVCPPSLGFVSTSMSGMYGAIKLNNSIEIRNSENKILDNITSKIEFNDFSPSKLLWLNDQFLLIYSQKSELNSKQDIFVYNRITKELRNPI